MKIYEYKEIEKNFKWGNFTAKLWGKEYEISKVLSHVKSPYKLILSIDSKKDLGIVNFKNIKLIENMTGKEKFTQKKITDRVIYSDNRKDYILVVFIENINLEYNDLNLELEIVFDDDPNIYKINKVFRKDYKEEIITFWDMLLGV